MDVLPARFVARFWHGGPDVCPKVGALVGALGVEDGKGVFEPNGNGPVEARPFFLASQGTCKEEKEKKVKHGKRKGVVIAVFYSCNKNVF